MSINPERSVELEMEVISPMFMAGAEPRGEPELRPPSLRGALRYWLRALLGAAGLHTARTFEENLFGVAGDKNAHAGAIALRIAFQGKVQATRGYQSYPGAKYLWFVDRETIPPKTNFVLRVSSPRSQHPLTDLEQVLAVLKVMTLLGGLGNRSHRFAGAVQVVDGPSSGNSLVVKARTPEELSREIADSVGAAWQVFKATPVPMSLPDFDVIHPNWCNIYVYPKTCKDVLELIDELGRKYADFRRKQPDAAVFADAMFKGSSTGEVQRPSFGLPMPLFYPKTPSKSSKDVKSSTKPETERSGDVKASLQAERRGQRLDRRASPIWMQVVRLANGEHAAVFTWFRSRFLPEGTRLVLTNRERGVIVRLPMPNDAAREAIIREFFNQLGLIRVNLA